MIQVLSRCGWYRAAAGGSRQREVRWGRSLHVRRKALSHLISKSPETPQERANSPYRDSAVINDTSTASNLLGDCLHCQTSRHDHSHTQQACYSLLASLYAIKPPVWLWEHFLKYREVYRAARSNPDAVLGGIVQVRGGTKNSVGWSVGVAGAGCCISLLLSACLLNSRLTA